MKRTFHFGKIAYTNPKRKANAVEVEVELRDKMDGHKELSVCACVWDCHHFDWETGGQILDWLAKYLEGNETYAEIHDLWKKYHLNGFHAGTHRQQEIVDEYFAKVGKPYDYSTACKVLKEKRRYTDCVREDLGEHLDYGDGIDPKHYKYGTGWLLWEIPEADLKRIEKLFEIPEGEL